MLNTCFNAPQNVRPMLPSRRQLTGQEPGSDFESRAFSAIWIRRQELGIDELWRCRAARVDGYLKTVDGEVVLLEMKEMLSWGSTQAAGFQFLAGRELLKLQAKRGVIVFERFATQWLQCKPNGAWGQLALEAAVVSKHVQIGALQVLSRHRVRSHAAEVP